jgi:hypothetical protein
MIFAPPRTRGPLLLAGAALLALALGVALIVRGLALPVSFGAYFALTLGALLFAAGLPLAYWAWAGATLRYELRGSNLVIRWGWVEEIVPAASIERIVLGRSLPLPALLGVRTPGLLAGRAYVRGIGNAAIFARYRQPADLLYIVAGEAAFGLALAEQKPFISAVQVAAREGAAFADKPTLRRGPAVLLGMLADRRALMLAAAALVPAWLSGLIVSSRYGRLGAATTVHFPTTESAHAVARGALVHIPEGALGWFAVALVAAAALHQRARLASYLVLAGSALAGVLFLTGAIAP